MYSPQRLRAVMDAQGRRNDWLAEITEYDPATVARVLTGAQPFSEKFAYRCARALGIPVEWLRDESITAVEAVPA